MNQAIPHRLVHMLILAISISTFSSVGIAQTPEVSWAKMQAILAANKTLTAREINSKYEIPGDSGKVSGSYKTTIAGHDGNGRPVRSLSETSKDAEEGMKMAALDFGIAHQFANYPAELFPTAASYRLVGTEQVNGEPSSIIKIHAQHSKKNLPVTANVWISERNSRPLRVEGWLEKIPIPGVKKVNFSIKYAIDQAGRSLPLEVTVAYTISLFFHTGDLYFSHRLADWQESH